MIDSYSFGSMGGTKYKTLSGTYVPATTGLYTLKINNTRGQSSSTLLYNYIDNVSIKPQYSTFNLNGDPNIPCISGGTRMLSISAGFAHKNKDYWIWMSASGTYPGFSWKGIDFPLNQDVLFWMGLSYPAFPGTTGMYGKLSGSGSGVANFNFPKNMDQSMVGFPINFIYVLLSPGLKPPPTAASFPIHVKYCP